MAQKTGALIFDEQTDRSDIRFDIADYYGGLHCGECFDVFTGGKWKPTRIEMSAAQEWYLVGIRAEDLNGLRVRIQSLWAATAAAYHPNTIRLPRKEDGKCKMKSTKRP